MTYKITKEYLVDEHNNSTSLNEKIIYLVSIIEELKYLKLLTTYEEAGLDGHYKDLVDIHNHLLHLRKNSLDKEVWDNRQIIYDKVVSIVGSHLKV